MQWLLVILVVVSLGGGIVSSYSYGLMNHASTLSLELSGVSSCEDLLSNESIIYDPRARRYRDKSTGRFVKVDPDLSC